MESLIGGKFELVEGVFAGVIFEHAEVGGVFEFEFGLGWHGCLAKAYSGDESGRHGCGCFENVASGGFHLWI